MSYNNKPLPIADTPRPYKTSSTHWPKQAHLNSPTEYDASDHQPGSKIHDQQLLNLYFS